MRLPKMSQWDLLLIEWVDSAGGDSGWHKPKKKELEIDGCITVGMVYAQSPDRIAMVLSRDTKMNNIDCVITIPTVAITSFTRLKAAPKPAA